MGVTARAGIRYPDGTIANNFSLHMSQLAQDTDDKYAIMRQGLLSARPTTPEQRSMYWATDDRGGRLYGGDGSTWFDLGPSPVQGPLTGYTGLITAAPSALVSDAVLGVRGKVGQTGDLVSVQDSTLASKFRVSPSGVVTAASDLIGYGTLRLRSTSPSTWRSLIDFENNAGSASHWQLMADISGSGSTDFGLYNVPAAAASWSSDDSRNMSVWNRLTVGNGARVSGVAVLDVAGEIGMRETDSLRVTSGATGRLVYQDSVATYMGAIDAARDLYLRSRGADRMRLFATGVDIPNSGRLTVGTSLDSSSRLRVDGGGTALNEYGVQILGLPNAPYNHLYLKSTWSTGLGGHPIKVDNISSALFQLTNTGDVQALGVGTFGNGAFGGAAPYVNVGGDGSGGFVSAQHSTAVDQDLWLHKKGAGRVQIDWPTPVALTFDNGWTNYSALPGFESGRFYVTAQGVVHLEGLIKGGTWGAGVRVAILPAGARPQHTHVFLCDCSTSTGLNVGVARVDVLSDGSVNVVGAVGVVDGTGVVAAGPDWLSLDNISFSLY